MYLLSLHDFVISCISLSENISSVIYVELPTISTIPYTVSKSYWLIPLLISSENSQALGQYQVHSSGYKLIGNKNH